MTGIDVPRLESGEVFRCYKISKRFDQDISAVLGAFRFTLEAVASPMHALPSAAWRPRRNGATATEAALKAFGLMTRRTGTRLRGAGIGFPAHRRHAGQRALPAGDGAGAAAQALHEAGGEASAATRLVGLRPGEAERAA